MAQSGPEAKEATSDALHHLARSIPGGESLLPSVDGHGRPTKLDPSNSSSSASSSRQSSKQPASNGARGTGTTASSSSDGGGGGGGDDDPESDPKHPFETLNPQAAKEDGDAKRSLVIAFMKCDQLHDDAVREYGKYEDVLHDLFEPILKDRTHASQTTHPSRLSLRTLVFDARKREYPSERQLRSTIDAVVISGSFQDGASEDTRWILRLAGFLIQLYDEFPRIRIIGICFGLQIIARAFGPSRIVPNPRGVEIGSTRLHLTELGRRILHPPGQQGRESLMLQQVHGDIVEGEVPEGFELLAWSDKTPIQAMARLYPDRPEGPPQFLHSTLADETQCGPPMPWANVHIIGIQGHPEWHQGVILPLIDGYVENGSLDEKGAEEARRATRLDHDGKDVGRALLAILGFV